MNDQVTPAETAEILRQAELCLGVAGDFVELGCYRGDTSVLLGKLLWKTCGKLVEKSHTSVDKSQANVQNLGKTMENCISNQDTASEQIKHLWIYDSFAGLPAKTAEDSSGAGANFQAGELLVTKREVIDKLRKNGLKISSHPHLTATSHLDTAANSDHANSTTSSVIVKKAWFDELEDRDLPEQIAFAFCDGDLYGSIKTSLKLVAPRLTKQGIIIVHDYNNPELPGSARAVDEFLRAHPAYRLQVRHTLAILTKVC